MASVSACQLGSIFRGILGHTTFRMFLDNLMDYCSILPGSMDDSARNSPMDSRNQVAEEISTLEIKHKHIQYLQFMN